MARYAPSIVVVTARQETSVTYFSVMIEETGESFRCSATESVLSGMERLGRKGIPVGCRGGGCGVCKVEVIAGSYTRRVMSRACVSAEEEAANIVLACRIRPTSDLRLQVLGKMAKNVCRPLAVEAGGDPAAPTPAQG